MRIRAQINENSQIDRWRATDDERQRWTPTELMSFVCIRRPCSTSRTCECIKLKLIIFTNSCNWIDLKVIRLLIWAMRCQYLVCVVVIILTVRLCFFCRHLWPTNKKIQIWNLHQQITLWIFRVFRLKMGSCFCLSQLSDWIIFVCLSQNNWQMKRDSRMIHVMHYSISIFFLSMNVFSPTFM